MHAQTQYTLFQPHIRQNNYMRLKQFSMKIIALLVLPLASLIDMIAKTIISNHEKIILIGEHRGVNLKDNGYYFFRYCREHYSSLPIYFVTNADSANNDTFLKQDPNVLFYGSIKHLLIFAKASFCLYTHDYRDLIYRTHFRLFGRFKSLVFLHHGVLGWKRFDDFYQENKNIMELFVVGTPVEEELLTKRIGVHQDKVHRLGYPRWDYLEERSSITTPKIVYLPTFRNDMLLGRIDDHLLTAIRSFLNSPELRVLLKNSGTSLIVHLHPEMRALESKLDIFEDSSLYIDRNDESTHALLEIGNLLITDYSSVSWDFFLLGKPVIFYRFDIEDYETSRGSYLDLRENLIGEVATNKDDLITMIEKHIKSGFKEKIPGSYKNRIGLHNKGKACRRILEKLTKLPASKTNFK